jgi:hypothetical protein
LKKKLKIGFWVILTLLFSGISIYIFRGFEMYFSIGSFIYAFDLLLMAWYAFSIPFLKLDYRNSYDNIKSIEREGAIYIYFGVNMFRWFLKTIGWNKITDKSNGDIIKDLTRLKKREWHIRESELGHFILFVHFLLIIFYFLPNYNTAWLMVLNILLHAFPVFIQRYNRPRYLRLISTLETPKIFG